MKNVFIATKKLFLFSVYLNLCPDLFDQVGKRIDKKDKFNFKTYDVINWKTNNYKTYITQYLKK